MPDGPVAPPPEIIHVDDRTVACDGGPNQALGHPRVFLYIEHERVMCPYCSRIYVLNPGAGHEDSPTLASRDHSTRGGLREQKDACQIHIDHCLPVLER